MKHYPAHVCLRGIKSLSEYGDGNVLRHGSCVLILFKVYAVVDKVLTSWTSQKCILCVCSIFHVVLCPVTSCNNSCKKKKKKDCTIISVFILKVAVRSRTSREESAGGKNVRFSNQHQCRFSSLDLTHTSPCYIFTRQILMMVQDFENLVCSRQECCCFSLNVGMNTSSVFPVVAMI